MQNGRGLRVPFVPDTKFASRGNVRQEKTYVPVHTSIPPFMNALSVLVNEPHSRIH
jgi:hypothetical protein